MPQELVTEPEATMRALDQSRNVGDDEAAIFAKADDAEVRRQCGERIIRNFRTRRRDARDQRGLARVREPDKADVGEKLQLETQEFLFAFATWFVASRRAIGRRGEARVAAAAVAAL